MSAGVLAGTVGRITESALQIMVQRASNLEPDESFSAADIVAAVVAEPTGPVALYLANLIAFGFEHYSFYVELATTTGELA